METPALRCAPGEAPIEKLPPELTGQITAHLALYEALRLGLASKILFLNVDPKLWAKTGIQEKSNSKQAYVDKKDRWEFLQELQITLPKKTLCHFCAKFHPSESLIDGGEPTKDGHGKPCGVRELQFPRWDIAWGLRFTDLYNAMNRHLFGADFGIPLSDFALSTNWTEAMAYRNLYNANKSPFKRFLSYKKLDVEALIVNNQFLLHRVQRLWLPVHLQGTDVLIRYGVGEMSNDFKICSHHLPLSNEMIYNFTLPLRDSLQAVLVAHSLSPDDKTGVSTVSHIAPCSQCDSRRLVKRCQDCPTEYEFTFHIHQGKSVEIVVDVWQNFGGCREPTEPGWFNCWGRLNPKYQKCLQDSERRTSWLRSTASYAQEKFTTPAGQSAVDHESAQQVLEHWNMLHTATGTSTGGKEAARMPKTPIESSLHERHLATLRRGIINSRYDGDGDQDVPPFAVNLTGHDRVARLAYTRSRSQFSCHTRIDWDNFR